MEKLLFAVYGRKKYITLDKLSRQGVKVPAGFVFDGVSVPWFVMWMFTHNELKEGIEAACVHDFMCGHKEKYRRREATSILLKLWKNAGLGERWYTSWKPWVVYAFVELYQISKGWK